MKRTASHSFFLLLLAAGLTPALLLPGCEFGTGKPDPLATEILRVEVEPNPVALGDTAVFTCVVKDSMNPDLQYQWELENGPIPYPTTDTNQYRWEAPPDTGRYTHVVEVSRPEVEDPGAAFTPVSKSFEVKVIEND
jgi:hypothetical protein